MYSFWPVLCFLLLYMPLDLASLCSTTGLPRRSCVTANTFVLFIFFATLVYLQIARPHACMPSADVTVCKVDMPGPAPMIALDAHKRSHELTFEGDQ